MWIDDDGSLARIYKNFDKIDRFPVTCPKCQKNSVHIYLHINDKTKRGGLWIWCSSCRVFFHGSVRLDVEWENCPKVEEEKLFAIPDCLDEIHDEIDKHMNSIKDRLL